jgi:hypothetical protein
MKGLSADDGADDGADEADPARLLSWDGALVLPNEFGHIYGSLLNDGETPIGFFGGLVAQ